MILEKKYISDNPASLKKVINIFKKVVILGNPNALFTNIDYI